MLSAQSTGAPVGTNPVGGTSAGAGGTSTGTGGFFITISNMSFSPVNLAVPAGGTVTVVNRDGILHSVTSEAVAGSFTPGAPAGLTPFDTGEFSSGQKTFTVPANATTGTVIPYYCMFHKQLMNTPTGTITIDPNAKPTTVTTTPTITSTPTTSMPGTPTPTTTPTTMPGTSTPMTPAPALPPAMPGY